MKKLVSLALSAVMACGVTAALAGCDGDSNTGAKVEDFEFKPVAASELKVGLICLHDDSSTYDKNFIDAMTTACKEKKVELVKSLNKAEDSSCFDAAEDLVSQGCKVIFADSFGHESYMMQAAAKYPSVQFCHATGTKALTHNLGNYHNAFASIYEGRYLAGVAAGMKLNTLETKKDAAGKAYYQIGYVGAYPYAEVISGFTSFYLGVKSVAKADVKMDVTYTYSWYSPTDEQAGAQFLIGKGAQLISQHADSMGAPNECEAKNVPNVTYNVSTKGECPKTYIAGSRINWEPYFEYMIDCVINGDKIDSDWCGNITTGSVEVLEFGSAIAEGTQAAVEEAKAKLEAGTVKVFDTANFTVGGKKLETYKADVKDYGDFAGETEVVLDGVFNESLFRSAPYFNLIIDGITEWNKKAN